MKDDTKIKKLEREIEKLQVKKEAKDKVNELLDQRNRLKYPWMFKAGSMIKSAGKGVLKFADKKSKEYAEAEALRQKQEKKKKKKKYFKEEEREEFDNILEGLGVGL